MGWRVPMVLRRRARSRVRVHQHLQFCQRRSTAVVVLRGSAAAVPAQSLHLTMIAPRISRIEHRAAWTRELVRSVLVKAGFRGRAAGRAFPAPGPQRSREPLRVMASAPAGSGVWTVTARSVFQVARRVLPIGEARSLAQRSVPPAAPPDRVLRRAPAAAATRSDATTQRARGEEQRPCSVPPPAAREQRGAPDVEQIAERVIRELDRRVIATRERLGRF